MASGSFRNTPSTTPEFGWENTGNRRPVPFVITRRTNKSPAVTQASPPQVPSFRELDRISRRAVSPADPVVARALEAAKVDLERLMSGALPPTSAEELKKAIAGIQRLEGGELPADRAQALCRAAALVFLAGDRHAAFEAARLASNLARVAHHNDLEVTTSNVLGWLQADAGNLSRATECHAHSIRGARARGDEAQEAAAWNFLGWTLYVGAQYEDALAAFERCLALPPGRVGGMGEASPEPGMAMCYLHLDHLDQALEFAEQVAHRAIEPRSAGELVRRVIAEGAYVRVLLAIGEAPRAGERAALAGRFAEASGSPRARIVAAMAAGMHGVIAGRVNSGARFLRAALKESRLHKTLLRDSLHCLVDAYTFVDEPEKALEYLDELMEETKDRQFDNLVDHVKLDNVPFSGTGAVDVAAMALKEKEAFLRGQVEIQRLQRKVLQQLERRAVSAEVCEDGSTEHPARVGSLAGLIAEELGCPPDLCRDIEQGARLHDIGKNVVPHRILLKPEALTAAEREEMQAHAVEGANLLIDADGHDLSLARQIVRHHHEWWNGSGYPDKLSGESIPLAARIAAVADAFDSLTHRRAYRKAVAVSEAIAMIKQAADTQFDPKIVEAFERVLALLRAREKDLDVYLAHESVRARANEGGRRTVSVALMLRNRSKTPLLNGI